MPCQPFTLPGGARGFICSRTPSPRCACGKQSAFQCDAPTGSRGRTCSRHLCADHATATGPDTHLCPTHAASGAPVQASMEF